MDKSNNSTRLIIDFSKLEENQVLKRIQSVQRYRRGTWVNISQEIFPCLEHDILGVVECSYTERTGCGDDLGKYQVVVVNKDCIPVCVLNWVDGKYLDAIHDVAFTEERGHLVIDYANILLFNAAVGRSVMGGVELTISKPIQNV